MAVPWGAVRKQPAAPFAKRLLAEEVGHSLEFLLLWTADKWEWTVSVFFFMTLVLEDPGKK